MSHYLKYHNNRFKVGDKVLILGDAEDFTESLDGLVGTVTRMLLYDCVVAVTTPDGDTREWLIWNCNMIPVGEVI